MTAAPESVGPELTCAACGYDLRGLPPHSMCPECGTPVERTVAAGPVVRWLPGFGRGATALVVALLALPFVEDAVRDHMRWFGVLINPDGRVLLARALLLFPAAWWMTRPATFLRQDPARLRPWIIGLTAAQALVGAVEIAAFFDLSFTGGVVLLSSYALGPFPYVVEMGMLFTLLVRALPVVPAAPPTWLARAVQWAVVYVLLSPTLMLAVINFARIRFLRTSGPRPGEDFVPADWSYLLHHFLDEPAYAVRRPVWLAAVALTGYCAFRLWRPAGLPGRANLSLPADRDRLR
jgi:hypothetical protein